MDRLMDVSQKLVEESVKPVNAALDHDIRAAKERQRQSVTEARDQVRTLAVGVPALILSLLVVAVAIRRRLTERSGIPVSRQRRTAA